MDWVNVITETLRYLEKNLLTVQGPKEVALMVHVSASYLQTSFQMITGYSISEYVRNRKLYLAAMDLLGEDVKVIDIAAKYGYETPESFTKAFSRFHDATPNEIKKKKKPVRTFLPLKLSFSVKGADTVDVVIDTTAPFFLFGKADVFENETCFQKIPGFVTGFIEKQLKAGNYGPFYGVSVGECENVKNDQGMPWLSDFDEDEVKKINFAERFLFLAGSEYKGGEIPGDMTCIEIPETLWAKFRCKDNSAEEIQKMRRFIFGEWLLDTDEYDLIAEYNIECYNLPSEDGKGFYNEIWLPVQRRSEK